MQRQLKILKIDDVRTEKQLKINFLLIKRFHV